MSWLAIPYSNKKSRRRLERQFGFFNHTLPLSILLDPTGLVLSINAASYFLSFGAEGFPFTSERILDIYSQEEELAKNPSLQTLLASTDRTYVTKNTGEAIQIT